MTSQYDIEGLRKGQEKTSFVAGHTLNQGKKYSAGPVQVKLEDGGAPHHKCNNCGHEMYSNTAAMVASPKSILHLVSNPKPLAERAARKKKRVKCGGHLVRQTAAGSDSGIKNFFSAGSGA